MVDFLILGNGIALHYNNVFHLVKNKQVRYGISIVSGFRYFEIPDGYEQYGTVSKIEDGKRYIGVSGVRWITSLFVQDRKPLQLDHSFRDGYKMFDNINAININKTEDIPGDYFETMGVPISFLDKWCCNQFDVLGKTEDAILDGKLVYTRILIKRKQ